MSVRSSVIAVAKAVVPRSWRQWFYDARFAWRERALRRQTPEEVFSEIYARNEWGGARGEYCSGKGTANDVIVVPYVAAIERLADERGFRGTEFVDIGCGDFSVGQRLAPLCSRYTGVDIVAALVERNQTEFGDGRIRFLKLDATRDELPEGDVCFVRQVLQHLGNDEIVSILGKLRQYRWVFITEHLPTPNPRLIPNLDKVHGGHIRLYANSGVYVEEPPFSLPVAALEHVLAVPGIGLDAAVDQGVIRTTLYTPRA